MKYHFVAVPALGGEAAAAELNRFLGAHRVTHVERAFVPDGPASFWSFCVTWQEGPTPQAAPVVNAPRDRKQVDYKELLTEAQFTVFARLRDLRKALAERDGVPVYSVFTNEQLAAMVQRPVTTLAGLEAIDGVGRGRLEKYGAAVLAVLTQAGASNAPA